MLNDIDFVETLKRGPAQSDHLCKHRGAVGYAVLTQRSPCGTWARGTRCGRVHRALPRCSLRSLRRDTLRIHLRWLIWKTLGHA